MRKIAFIFILTGLLGLFLYSTREGQNSVIEQGQTVVKKLISNNYTQPQITEVSANQANSISTDQSVSEGGPARDLGGLSASDLMKWVQSESKAMNSMQNNTEETQIRLKAQAITLNAAQLKTLEQIVTNFNLPINDRILSAYMISLSNNSESQEELFQVAKSDIPNLGPVRPHTDAEIRHTQELAIRYMQVDELFQRAKTDANAKDKLKLLSLDASSEQVRSYAKKRLQELK